MKKTDAARQILISAFALVMVVLLSLAGCEGVQEPTSLETSKPPIASGQQLQLSKADSRIMAAMLVQEKHTARLMASSDVVGTAVGLDDAGEVVVQVVDRLYD